MKISTQILLAFLLIALIPLLTISFLAYYNTRSALTSEVLNHLESVADIQENRIESIVEQNLERLSLVSSRTQLRLSLHSYIESPNSADQERMDSILLDACASVSDFENISVITLDGTVVAATDTSRIGATYPHEAVFLEGQTGNNAHTFFIGEDGRLAMYLNGPLYLEDELLGVVVVESAAEHLVGAVTDYTGLGNSGETVLAARNMDGDAVFLAPTRFEEGAALSLTVAEEAGIPIIYALAGEEIVLTDTVDYRDEPVLAATRYVDTTGWGLVTKIDRAEALAAVSGLQAFLIAITLLSLALVLAVALYLTRLITRPIKRLTEASTRVSEGDLSKLVEVESGNEVGALGHSFNEMIVSLRKSEQRYRTTLDSMLEGCQIIDPDYRYVYINDSATKHGRKSKQELLGRTMVECYPGIEKTEMFTHLKRCMEERVSHRMENEFIYPDGSKGWFDLSLEPVAEGVFILSVDITQRKRAMETLRESEEKFNKAFHASSNLMGISTLKEGRIIDINEAYARLTGYKRKEIIGRTVSEVNIWARPEQRRKMAKILQEKGTVHDLEVDIRNKSGEIRTVLFSADTVMLKGEPCLINMAIDITDRKQAIEKLRKSEELLNEVSGIAKIGGWEMDLINRTAKWTRATYDIAEIDYGAPIPGPDEHVDYYLPEYRPLVAEAMRKLIEEDIPLDFEAKLQTAKGNIIWCRAMGKAIRENGKCVKVRGTFQDVTELKEAELALKQWSVELEDRVKQRTAELEQRSKELAEANVNLEEMSRHKSQFLANMSHELRTPLNSIIGYTKLMLDGLEGEINDEQQKDLQTVYNNSRHLLSLINDLLDLSKIEAGKVAVSYESFTIDELLDDVIPSVKQLAEGKGLSLQYKVTPGINHLYADRAKTKQTLINILGNAVKFTEKGGINLDVAEKDSEFVFSVSDTGLGIKKKDLGAIFDSFEQVGPSHVAGFEGTGLGLAISKQFVEMQGGRIWVDSQFGKGSTFTFTLPKKAPGS
ncbi:MAG: PAS domain S-box protein [Dehalococcoidia bacterium]|jgi:PAS domain S-box-containing protein